MSVTPNKVYGETGRSENSANNASSDQDVEDSDHPQQQPDYSQECQSVSKVAGFQVSVTNLIPITSKIKQENNFLVEQKTSIQRDLTNLDKFSNMLLQQNQALRCHFEQRRKDLQSMLISFTINNQQDLSDAQHLVFSYREHNRMYNTKIDSLSKQLKSIEGSNLDLQKKLDHLVVTCVELEKLYMHRKAKVQANKKISVQGKLQKYSVEKLDDLEADVSSLSVQVGQARSQNIKMLKNLSREQYQLQKDKTTEKSETVEIIRHKTALKGHIENMQQKLVDLRAKNNNKEDINNTLIKTCKEVYSEKERTKLKIGILSDKIRQSQELNEKSTKKFQSLTSQLIKKQQTKSKLLEQLQKLDTLLANQTHQTKSKKEQLERDTNTVLEYMREEMEELQNDLNNELTGRVFGARRDSDRVLSNLRYDLSILENKSKELEKSLAALKEQQARSGKRRNTGAV